MWLERVNSPADLKALGQDELRQLATEIRDFIVNTVSVSGGHLRSNLGAVERKVVALVGDGAMTGGMAFEGLNNLGHSGRRVVIVLNDNGRSYAPTISRLSEGVSRLRLNPSYVAARVRLEQRLRGVPGVGEYAYSSLQSVKAALRELVEPMAFFENLGVRYSGPIDGHDIPGMEQALRHAADYDGPIV